MENSLTPKHENPFSIWQQDMKNLVDRFYRQLDLPVSNDFPLKVEVKEKEKSYRVLVEAPGMNEKDISVTLRDNVLILEGERKKETEEEEKDRYFSEFSYGSFYRSIKLDNEVNPESVKASYKDGILTVTLEKMRGQTHTGKKIPITNS